MTPTCIASRKVEKTLSDYGQRVLKQKTVFQCLRILMLKLHCALPETSPLTLKTIISNLLKPCLKQHFVSLERGFNKLELCFISALEEHRMDHILSWIQLPGAEIKGIGRNLAPRKPSNPPSPPPHLFPLPIAHLENNNGQQTLYCQHSAHALILSNKLSI